MATFDGIQLQWTLADVHHFCRRAGFGVTPEQAAELVRLAPEAAVQGWLDGTLGMIQQDLSVFAGAVSKADVVPAAASGAIPADPAPHPYRLEGWRRNIANLQADFAWRLQYNPWQAQEKLTLFWHQVLATGADKVDNPALMVKHLNLLRTLGRGRFAALLLAVSQDPAMMIWLDTIQNRVRPNSTDVANENYAREILELYSLGVDNGYNQADITNLARAFSGWTYTPLDVQTDPNNPNISRPNDGQFRVNPAYHATGTVTFLGQTFDLGAGTQYGATLVGAILDLRPSQCAEFLAKRLLRFFVTSSADGVAIRDLQTLIQELGFDMGRVLKAVFRSAYFFESRHRFALYEGPVAWTVRAARMLTPSLGKALAAAPVPRFPAWKLVVPSFQAAGQAVLDPDGPNGWEEHEGWINSNTMRYRGKLAAALTMKEASSGIALFPGEVSEWFPSAPSSVRAVYDRLAALLQPATIPDAVQEGWLKALWPTFVWDTSAATQQKVRDLAYLMLVSPWGQVH